MLGVVARKCALTAIAIGVIAGALCLPAAPASAEWHRFHGGAVITWGPDDIGLWRGGYWRHGWYGDRMGWWWAVGGAYYWYPEPVYPYPAVASEVYITQPPLPSAAPAPQPPPMYYYCDNPAGYYPYVPVCSRPFRPVPVTPQR